MRDFLQFLFVIALKVLAATWRITIIGDVHLSRGVVAFWHGKMMGCWKFFSKKQASAVTSLSKDGDVLAALLKSWGYTVIRGSSSKGGKQVLDDMVDTATTSIVLVTPDGPRGPLHQCKAGAVITAQRAEVPLILCRIEVQWKIVLNSWDKFEIPLPFSKITIQFLPPITISKQTERGEISQILEKVNQLLSLPIS